MDGACRYIFIKITQYNVFGNSHCFKLLDLKEYIFRHSTCHFKECAFIPYSTTYILVGFGMYFLDCCAYIYVCNLIMAWNIDF